ncbi:hypothetical protein FBQ83_08070 [Chloroflexi bacterium CFX5]|nr:hypothetical protein [Chloroflexi bacterium CFX5]NUQ59589.1 hypothetical protein [Anaerolineales bacterium]
MIIFALNLLPLVYLQRLLHREIQIIFFLLTRSKPLTIALFSLLFLPGVLLHEASHYLTAKLLGVRTGRFTVIPQAVDRGLILGSVEVERTDILRDSLIGLAPIVAGTLFIAYVAVAQLRLDALWRVLQNGQMNLFFMGLGLLPRAPDFNLWFYLTFVVSSAMLPSESDRHAWLPLGLWVGALLAAAVFAGAGAWMLANLAPFFDSLMRSVSLLIFLSNVVHLVLWLPLYLIRSLIVFFSDTDSL